MTGEVPFEGTSDNRVICLVAYERKVPPHPDIDIHDGTAIFRNTSKMLAHISVDMTRLHQILGMDPLGAYVNSALLYEADITGPSWLIASKRKPVGVAHSYRPIQMIYQAKMSR